ncbi:MAG TPA: hypothetical protein PKG84_02510 [Novosphingobium sp.]|nr:hypothetical protein [Novosphingobium sp.]
MSMHFRDIAVQAAADGMIGAEEILALRQAGWADGKMDPEEAEALFSANEHLVDPSPEWSDFFVEALTEFIVNTVHPKGYVDEIMAEELVARIDRDGRVATMTELELLVKVLEKATSTPASLKAYALRQIEEAVISGEGPTRNGQLDPGGINTAECALLRRMIFAAGGDRPASVSKAEAEMLFRIKDATLYDANADEWEKLFVQGVANFLLGFGGHEPLDKQRMVELEAFMNAEGAGIGAFLGRMLRSEVDDNVGSAFGSLLDLGTHGSELEAEVEEAAQLTDAEELWLLDHVDADEELDPLEKALLQFIAEETGENPLI